MADQIFPEGIFINKPHEKAPDFIKANLSLDAKKLQEWLQTHPELRDEKGYVRLVGKESKEGKWYLAVDTYKPKEKEEDEEIPF